MSTVIPTIKLNSGYDFPMIGFGTFGGNDGSEQVYSAAKAALEVGYKHFDTAYIYETEEALGKAIKESKIPREELFITTKLWPNFREPQHVSPVFERSLKNLGTDYVDLYLIHWPISVEFKGYEFSDCKTTGDMKNTHVPIIDTWRAMEKLVKDGKARSIGVSNFTIPMLEDLLSKCDIPPAVNQVEIHPALPQEELLAYCKSKNIVLTAYSPLGNPGYRGAFKTMEEPIIFELAKKYNKTPVQILLNWGVNRGYAVIPKSVTPSRIKDNLTYFKMEDDDIEAVTALGRKNPIRICDPKNVFGPDCDIFA
ncbi:NADP-dependent oxidoreductase domain-containing protein [Cokeromyces recurvatus]|uniref:NADP-dependent oxidoreductase domain-containing protein n=1 Tax=Cokeromyces recurvatus TaxID=90255 RepID=UPI00221E7770|nr:NADP-dependent oxidoreductase domain-containing protein [Cokeromyces recurvatus]KAI7905138.1 NADP-dependent oxidoreductase domain-containing protein [Cokeromyces recurvatus]